jgi:hypothetical protein
MTMGFAIGLIRPTDPESMPEAETSMPVTLHSRVAQLGGQAAVPATEIEHP